MDDTELILSFTDPGLLREWALKHNKLFHADVRNRLMQLETPIEIVGKKVGIFLFILHLIMYNVTVVFEEWTDLNSITLYFFR